MPHSCLLAEVSKAMSACSETLEIFLCFTFLLYFCPDSVHVKEMHKGTWRNGTGLKQLGFFPYFLLCIKEIRLPNGAENSW